MDNNRFEIPVTVKSRSTGSDEFLHGPVEAMDFLLKEWPAKKGPKHRAAVQACHDAIDGGRPTSISRKALVAAAREADIFVSDKAPT